MKYIYFFPVTKKDFKFSDGWLTKFKKRWNLRVIKNHGEIGDADMTEVAKEPPNIIKSIDKYDINDIFNADELRYWSVQMQMDRKSGVDDNWDC